jgi:hypothetical protein
MQGDITTSSIVSLALLGNKNQKDFQTIDNKIRFFESPNHYMHYKAWPNMTLDYRN